MRITEATIKKLYALSGNQCAHPECKSLLCERDTKTEQIINHSHIAHIKGRKPGAERYDPELSENDLHHFDNLILLYARHHNQIDQRGAGEIYSVELIKKWKSDHTIIVSHEENDRSWVLGHQSFQIISDHNEIELHYYFNRNNELRFYSDDMLRRLSAASDLAMTLVHAYSLINFIESADSDPADMSRISKNDSYVRIFKEDAANLRRSFTQGHEYKSFAEKIFKCLQDCGDITGEEIARIQSGGTSKTTLVRASHGDSIQSVLADLILEKSRQT